jgi:hypothetical protein
MDEDYDGNLAGAHAGQAQFTREGHGFPLRLTKQDLLARERDRIEGDQTHAHLGEGRGDSQSQDECQCEGNDWNKVDARFRV